ncbi:hypothetical protein DFH08DRAFT_1037016 [Mycena albidolilacea]|uniref:Uncharacterized protein n=1 Tax=Mycena albidolilacea TaxID=1033008 RepID=A0AAD7EED4_9AGAR|nr:hypothetical protein DFH08DRAFT_1037016 [Mycena albidolilacea]
MPQVDEACIQKRLLYHQLMTSHWGGQKCIPLTIANVQSGRNTDHLLLRRSLSVYGMLPSSDGRGHIKSQDPKIAHLLLQPLFVSAGLDGFAIRLRWLTLSFAVPPHCPTEASQMLSLFKKRLSSGSSSAASSGLKPLFLVEKLVFAKAITPVEASSIVEPQKNTRPPRGPPRVAADRRPSAQTAMVQQRPPFVVSMHVGTPDRVRPVPKPTVRGTAPPPPPKPEVVVRKASPPRSSIPKLVKGHSSRRLAVVAVKSPKKTTTCRSRIPVSIRYSSSLARTPAGSPPARSSHSVSRSKTPVLARRCSPDVFSALRTSHSSTGDLSFNVQTPCPSHILVVQARPLARKDLAVESVGLSQSPRAEVGEDSVVCESQASSPSVATQSSELTTATKAESSSNQVASTEVTQNIKASPDSTAIHASPVSSSGNADSVRRPASSDSCSLRKTKTTTNTAEDSSVVGAFISELKSSDKDNTNGEEKSELQQVLALRRQAIVESSYKIALNKQPAPTTESRRPLAPTQNRPANGVFVGTQASESTKDMHLHHPTSTDAFSSSDDNDDCSPPGADFTVTELVAAAFGTRRVRRLVIPSLAEGARPSRDPRIVAELKFLRARQKVGGGAKADKVA